MVAVDGLEALAHLEPELGYFGLLLRNTVALASYQRKSAAAISIWASSIIEPAVSL